MSHENDAANQPKGVEVPSITLKCLNVVKQYHAGHTCKGDVILELTKAIPVGEIETVESVGKTLKFYISLLDDWDHKCTLSDADEHNKCEPEQIEHTKDGRGYKCAKRDDGYRECNEPVHQ
jgi:hypothetical protein